MAWTRWSVAWIACLLLVGVAGTVLAQGGHPPEGHEGGVLVRVDGNVTIAANESVEVLVIVGGGSHANLSGTAHVVVVVDGTLDLHGNITERLVLVNAHAVLHNGSIVAGDISTTDADLERRDGSTVMGAVTEGQPFRFIPLFGILFGIIFVLGIPIAVLLAGVLLALLFPRQVRNVNATMTRNATGLLMAFVLVWILLPLVAVVALFTVVGIPTAVGILFVLLPLLWFVGYLLTGVRLGQWLMRSRVKAGTGSLLGAALVGLALLMLVGFIPAVGGLVGLLAGLYGGTVLARYVWQGARRARQPPAGATPTPATPAPPAPEASAGP